MENVQLKPCPFCGSDKVQLWPQGSDAAVHCLHCGARGEVVDNAISNFYHPDYESAKVPMERKAVEVWNTRAPAEAKDAWRDISTAPRGENIEVYRPRVKGPCVAYLTDRIIGPIRFIDATCPESGKTWIAEWWRPLSPAPANDNEGEKV